MERQKKRLYHSELVEMGEVTVDITSDVRVSKFGNRNKYVEMILDGNKREYYVENETCADELAGRAGQRVTFAASGSRDDALINISASEWTPKGAGRPAAAPAPANRPAPQRQAPAPAPAPRNDSQRPQSEKVSARRQLIKLTNMMLMCEAAVDEALKRLQAERGIVYDGDARQAKVAMLYINMTRDNYHHQQPDDKLISVAPKDAAHAVAATVANETQQPSDNDGAA